MSVNAPTVIARRHGSQLTPFHRADDGTITLDLDDIDGAGTAVHYVYLHAVGGIDRGGPAGPKELAVMQGTAVNFKIGFNFGDPRRDFGNRGLIFKRENGTTVTITSRKLGVGTGDGLWAVISY